METYKINRYRDIDSRVRWSVQWRKKEQDKENKHYIIKVLLLFALTKFT